MKRALDPIIQQAMDESPVPVILVRGRRHILLIMEGQQVGSVPTRRPSEMTRRLSLNVRAQIRRRAEAVLAERQSRA